MCERCGMPLILAHGQRKSASSYLFQIAKAAAEHVNREPLRDTRAAHLAKVLPGFEDFIETVDAVTLNTLLGAIPEEIHYVVKTHGPLKPAVRKAIEKRKVVAFTSCRDPRDVCISLLDAGRTARAKQPAHPFAKISTLPHALRLARREHRALQTWVASPGVVVFPFYLTAADRTYVVNSVCAHIGLRGYAPAMLQQFGPNGTATIWMFEKGISDRFLDDLQPEEIRMLTRELREEIEATDGLCSEWMSRHGFGAHYRRLREMRDRRLSDIL